MPGEIQRARREATHAGGGAVVAAATLAELGAEVEFYGAVGCDALGDAAAAELTERGITVHMARRPGATREVITLLDGEGERTILPIGERIQPEGDDALDWDRLAQADGVYVTAGDAGVLDSPRRARAGGHAAATRTPGAPRGLHRRARVQRLGRGRARWAERMEPDTRLMVATDGAAGGRWWGASEGRWASVPPPGPVRDSYGCGDAFAAGFTYGLGMGRSVAEAAQVGARWGAEMLTRVGAP